MKWILKYITGNYNYGILDSHDTYPMLVGYCDGSVDDKKVHQGDVSSLTTIWFLGSIKSKIMSHYLLLKLSTLLLEAVANNYSVWNRCWRSTMLNKMSWHCSMTTWVLSIFQKILFNTTESSILTFVIISLGILWKIKWSIYST